MRIANLTHGALFMLGAYVGVTVLKYVPNLWLAALIGGLVVAAVSAGWWSASSCASSRATRWDRCW